MNGTNNMIQRIQPIMIPHTEGPTLAELGLTIVHPFYNEEQRLKIQFDNWVEYSDEIKSKVNIIIADDCSEIPVHSSIIRENEKLLRKKKELDINLKVFRVKKDLKWNTPGALNLGIENSKTFWTLIMDSDCLLKPEDLEELLTLRPDNMFAYWFHRKRVSNISVAKGHTRFLPCSILFNKDTYENTGGFDEDFSGEWSGGYGFFDNDYNLRVLEEGYTQGVLESPSITEYLEDIVGPNIQQKTGVTRDDHHKVNKRLWHAKMTGSKPRNRNHLNFEWHKTLEYRRSG